MKKEEKIPSSSVPPKAVDITARRLHSSHLGTSEWNLRVARGIISDLIESRELVPREEVERSESTLVPIEEFHDMERELERADAQYMRALHDASRFRSLAGELAGALESAMTFDVETFDAMAIEDTLTRYRAAVKETG